MSIILFIVILGVLIFVHELGHFLVAKYTGMRVDAFALGFPPTLWKKKIKGTEYALNLIPFGGYVKIFGENPDELSTGDDVSNSFTSKNRFKQALVLIAGVTFNIIFAWILLFIALLSGFSSPIELPGIDQNNAAVVISNFVEEDTPAEVGGLMVDDRIVKLSTDSRVMDITIPEEVVSFVSESRGEEITIDIIRGEEMLSLEITPNEDNKIGTSLEYTTIGSISIIDAFTQSFVFTGYLIKETTIGLIGFFGDLFTLNADMETVSGPIGIVSLVDQAAKVGFSFVLVFTALISINLAIINLLPIPALDGGRLLFVAVESIIRKPINYKFQVWANTIGFSILMILMIILTISDVGKLF
jgi:regulator of sigma E protease